MVKLKILLEQIIKEVGDLDNITPYSHKNNSFITDKGWEVEVSFDEWDEDSMEAVNINTKTYNPPVYNVSYRIEGVETQFTKTTYGSLIKILKTVVVICEEFVKKIKPNGLILFAANRDEDKILSKTDPSKSKLYHAIAIKYIFKKLPNYTLVNVGIDDNFKGFMVYNKEKINK